MRANGCGQRERTFLRRSRARRWRDGKRRRRIGIDGNAHARRIGRDVERAYRLRRYRWRGLRNNDFKGRECHRI